MTAHRVVIVDDLAELRSLLRIRLGMLNDIEVVAEASNGAEAVDLVRTLAPEAVVLDLEMPVMTGLEAIPLMRELHPDLGIVLYTATPASVPDVTPDKAPDAIVGKGESLERLVDELRALFVTRPPFEVLRFALGTIPLMDAVAAFDSWAALNMRILEVLSSPSDRLEASADGPTRVELLALVGMCAHLGECLQSAARSQRSEVELVVHAFRSTAQDARRALERLVERGMEAFLASWDFVPPSTAAGALALVWQRLLEVLPSENVDTS
ncbi:MAG TPA: response regulator transcription factor [Acidimicrobiales bacterium]|nr:response regulator transcription factor [Acidimicrobiales bacterium]